MKIKVILDGLTYNVIEDRRNARDAAQEQSTSLATVEGVSSTFTLECGSILVLGNSAVQRAHIIYSD